MRYIEYRDGAVVICSGNITPHLQMTRLVGRRERNAVSAGFLSARYSADEAWVPYGDSVGLTLKCNPELVIPKELFVAKVGRSFLYASSAELLAGHEDVQPAVWGLSDEGPSGRCAVYVPMHPSRKLEAHEAFAS